MQRKWEPNIESNDTFRQKGPVIPFSFDINVLFSGYEKCDPLHCAGPCYKKGYIIHLVLSGKGRLLVNDTEYFPSAGDMFLIAPTDYIFYQADGEDPWEYRWIKFQGNSLPLIFEASCMTEKRLFHTRDAEEFRGFEEAFKEVFDYMGDDLAPYIRATGRFYLFLGAFCNRFGEIRAAGEEKMNFMRIIEYVNKNYTSPDIDMETIAKAACYNRSHIYKLFMKNLGYSPKEYIDELRMSLACEMLHETVVPVKDVGVRAGYKSYMTFVKVFKKKYSILPTEYRSLEISSARREASGPRR